MVPHCGVISSGRWMLFSSSIPAWLRVMVWAVGKLDEVKTVVDIGLQLVRLHVGRLLVPVLELAGKTYANDGQRLGTDILRELEELKETQSVRLIVVGEIAVVEGVLPAVLVQRTVLHGPYRILPLIARREVGTLNDASAREAEDARMQVFQGLCQVAAHAVLANFLQSYEKLRAK